MDEELFDFNDFMPHQLHGVLTTISLLDLIDVLIVAILLYKIYTQLQDTRAITLAKGLLVLLGVRAFSALLNLHVVEWILDKLISVFWVAIPIVFQPELRRGLERLGQAPLWGKSSFLAKEDAKSVVNELVKAAQSLSNTKTGALIVIERGMGLKDIAGTGIKIDALITTEFLLNVFIVNTPLHDGAAIIRGKRLIAAGCVLPLTENTDLEQEMGTRHRAAIGLSEQCDALIVVVSEETGKISIAEEGHISRGLTIDELRQRLKPAFAAPSSSLKVTIKETLKDIGLSWRQKFNG